jgi:site-specific DNA-adenine methylase
MESSILMVEVYCVLIDFSFNYTGITSHTGELYSDFSIKEVDVQRAINCKGSKRAGHKELLIYNYS